MTISKTPVDHSIPAMRTWSRLPEGILAEVINGKLYVSDSPTPHHQTIALGLIVNFANFIRKHKLGTMYIAPTDLYLTGNKSVTVPDIIFISKKNKLVVGPHGLHGVPDLLIEVLSPSTRRRDLTLKKSFYEKAGVNEYWIIDPTTKESQGYLLKNKKYGDPLLLNSEINVRALKKAFKF